MVQGVALPGQAAPAGPGSASADVELLELVEEGADRDPEQLGGKPAVSAGPLEGPADDLAFELTLVVAQR